MRVMNKTIWPFQSRVQLVSGDDIYRWCEENLYHGGHYYNQNTNTWCFKDQKEFMMFCLRWGL